MSENTQTETRQFQAEAKQLLKLMTHSLYSNREIFLRELISNASDACDKLRFEALDNGDLYAGDSELKIRIDVDKDAKTIVIADNGIGMNRDEVIANIGTIASSGTAKFLEKMTGDQKKDSSLIGQFGVGFYSAFIVADKVEVTTLRAGSSTDQAVHWVCSGEADYQIQQAEKASRGTTITLHLKSDAAEFLNDWTLRSIIKKYSDHITIPVEMLKQDFSALDADEAEADADEKDSAPEYETVNSVQALWSRPRSEISDEEYESFYRHLSSDYDAPLAHSHNRVEGKLDYTSLLYIPRKPLFDMYQREAPRGLKLYVRRTFILDDADQFLPLYLRFVKGVVDTNDLPLNVSREILQDSPQVESIKSALTKRVLDMLSKMAKKKPEDYATVWKAFGSVLKEGVVEDFSNKEKIAELMRMSSTETNTAEQDQSFDNYIERMKEGQNKIFYLVGDSFNAVSKSPLLETFRKQGIEVLLLHDRIDEWLMSNLTEFKDKPLQDISRGKIDDLVDKAESSDDTSKEDEAESSPVVARVSGYLKERVEEVRVSNRLVDSPACLVLNEHDMGAQMRRILEASGQEVPESKPILELNTDHPLIQRLDTEQDETRFEDLADIIFDQASLAVGQQLTDPAGYVQRINRLLLDIA